jgi:pyrroline-5-carboxylate reductase
MDDFPAIAFIGGGNMARSLVGGLVARGWPAARLHVAEPHAPLREALARDFGVAAHADNAEAARAAGAWLFAVKPQVLRSVAEALAPVAQARRPVAISIAAGITAGQLDRWLGGGIAVVRAMPNTPALLGAGATGLHANAAVDAAQHALVERILGAAGTTAWIADEAAMDAVTAMSGSGPAYVFLLAEAMQAAGEAEGLDPAAARALALQTILGAARMLVETGDPPDLLRQRVTSPNGTTQAALETFEAGGFRGLVAAAIAAAARRARELSAANEDAPAPGTRA